MYKLFFAFVLIIGTAFYVKAQNVIQFNVVNSTSKEPLIGVTVSDQKLKKVIGISDIKGQIVLTNIPNGTNEFVFNYAGFRRTTREIKFPLSNTSPIIILLYPNENEVEEVIVSSTRTNSRIEDIAMRVEVLGKEEMDEENMIKPANITSIVGDVSIIHIQQTSSVNGNATLRMQGIDGKYTQLLRDGLPLYEGFSGSFGILQIPPLDLKQVEIVKGSVSTLYGGGAIGGMINFITKEPKDSGETIVTINTTTLKESNINAFISRRNKKMGFTFFASNTYQKAIEIQNQGFSVIPQLENIQLHPKLFFYFSPTSKLTVGYTSQYENRLGGDMIAIQNSSDTNHTYYQLNKSFRNNLDLIYTKGVSKENTLTIKNTSGLFNRSIKQSDNFFDGRQFTLFTECSFLQKIPRHKIVYGINHVADYFTVLNRGSSLINSYHFNTLGTFVQDEYSLFSNLNIEGGLRTDFHNVYGIFVLPRIALVYKFTPTFTLRLSAGKGYKAPNIFTQQTLAGSFKNLNPLGNQLSAERSNGANCDINYRLIIFDEVSVTLNQAFFYTQINNTLSIDTSNNSLTLINTPGYVDSKGTDSYVRVKADELEWYIGYNHTIARKINSGGEVYLPFSPHDKFSTTMMYEIEGRWRFGIESMWLANQYIENNIRKRNYWTFAALIERKIKNVSIVLNCENLTDVRQTRFEKIVNGPINNPTFSSIWAPLDGRVLNLAIRINIK